MNKSLVEIQAGYDEPEDDFLTWAAKNIHAWVHKSVLMHGESGYSDYCFVRDDELPGNCRGPFIDEDQWLDCRAELQNKPPVSSWPEWVKWIAQWHVNGQWFGYEVNPHEGERETYGFMVDTSSRIHKFGNCGEVLGDWRETLTERPDPEADKKEDAEKAMDLLKNAPMHNGELSNKAVEFCQSIGATWDHGLREWVIIESANPQWHGPEDGLPPAGESFDFSYNGISWEERTMLYNDGITCLMAHKKYPGNRWHYKCDDPDIRCRPIKSDKEKWAESASDIGSNAESSLDFAEAIYDAIQSGKLPMPESLCRLNERRVS